MIGGVVIEIIELNDRMWINCREKIGHHECAIYVEKTNKSRSISEGDIIWWQAGWAMWTPAFNRGEYGSRCGKDFDIRLKRIGYSGVNKPSLSI